MFVKELNGDDKNVVLDECFPKLGLCHLFSRKASPNSRLSRESYDLRHPFIPKHTDMIHFSLSKESSAGYKTGLRSKRRSLMREEDERFKPHDLDQDIHQEINIFMLIKQAPPDAIFQPEWSLSGFGKKKTKLYLKTANKGRRKMVFEEGEKVWVHLRKERIPDAGVEEKKFTLMPRIDGPFKITRRINNNAYQLGIQGKYNVSYNFNVSDLIPFDAEDLDLRTNPFQVGGDDMILASTKEMEKEPELEPEGNNLEDEKHRATMGQIAPFELEELNGGFLKPTAHQEAMPHVLNLTQTQYILHQTQQTQ